jgi:opacity protein-like surface antigen
MANPHPAASSKSCIIYRVEESSMFSQLRTATFVVVFLLSSFSFAQVEEHFNFGGGAGFTVPADRAGNSLNTGYNLNLRGGWNVSSFVAADLDFTYNHSGLNDATLARFGEPGGSVGIWSLTFNPVVKLAPSTSRVQPYFTAGYGLYHANLTLTQPSIVPTLSCDPFFGFCTQTAIGVDQVVASNSTLKSGFNAGGGFDFRVGHGRMKIFSEARYHRMFTTHGEDVSFVPVTFGFRW